MRRGLVLLVALAAVVVAVGIAYAQVTGPTAVKTSPSFDENWPAATANWFAWTQNPTSLPGRWNIWAEATPIDGSDAFRVNPAGTRGATGGIDGDRLVYQQASSGQSDIVLFNLASKTHEPPHPELNTGHWEWHPTVSTHPVTGQQWVEFGRVNNSTDVEKVLLHNMTTHETRTLVSKRASSFVAPDQVKGNYAVFTVCLPRCNVRVHDITANTTTTIPKPSYVEHQYASSLDDDGTIYLVRSGRGCGKNVRIVRYEAGDFDLLFSLPETRDIFFTHTSDEGDTNHVYYDQVNCRTGRWNIFKLTDPETP
jgi:hypothetical protein